MRDKVALIPKKEHAYRRDRRIMHQRGNTKAAGRKPGPRPLARLLRGKIHTERTPDDAMRSGLFERRPFYVQAQSLIEDDSRAKF